MKSLRLAVLFFPVLSASVFAEDILSVRNIGMELARDIASETVLACRAQGYQVSAVVVDRNGIVRAALRDDLAARFTLQISEEKANIVIMSGIPSGEFRKSREDIRPELNHIDGLIVMEGGVPINAGGYTPVLESGFGLQIVHVKAIEDVGGKSLEEATPEIQEKLYNEVVDQKYESWLQVLRERSHIKIIN